LIIRASQAGPKAAIACAPGGITAGDGAEAPVRFLSRFDIACAAFLGVGAELLPYLIVEWQL